MACPGLTARFSDGMGRALCHSVWRVELRDLMAKPELGTKRVCVACATRFYDLAKAPAVCPKCGTEQPTEQPRARRTGGNVVEEKRVKKVPAPGLEDADVEIETAEEEAEEDDPGVDAPAAAAEMRGPVTEAAGSRSGSGRGWAVWGDRATWCMYWIFPAV